MAFAQIDDYLFSGGFTTTSRLKCGYFRKIHFHFYSNDVSGFSYFIALIIFSFFYHIFTPFLAVNSLMMEITSCILMYGN